MKIAVLKIGAENEFHACLVREASGPASCPAREAQSNGVAPLLQLEGDLKLHRLPHATGHGHLPGGHVLSPPCKLNETAQIQRP